MDIGRTTTTTEVQAHIGMFHCYSYMWTRWYPILSPMTEADSGAKSRKILWNGALEDSFKGI